MIIKKESEKTILDKLDEIGAPVHNILEGTESEYKGFKPLEIQGPKSPNSPIPPVLNKKKKHKKRKKKGKRRK